MNIKELKRELNISNADIAKCFNMTYGAFANSTAKERYENALLSFYKLAKKGWEKNKTKNLIVDDQTIKDEPEQLIIHDVGCSFCGGREFRTTKNYKPAKKCCECSRVRML